MKTQEELIEKKQTLSDRCIYRNCRHVHDLHGKQWKQQNGKQTGCHCQHFTSMDTDNPFKDEPLIINKEVKELQKALDKYILPCPDCEEPLSSFDIKQTKMDNKKEPWTYVKCANCKIDWAAWKIFRRIELIKKTKK